MRNEFIDILSKNYLEKNYDVFTGKSDLYVYFFEKVENILKEKGLSGFIVSSKYTKTKYGKYLIDFLNKNTSINAFIDFQDLDVFNGIVAYPSVILFQKRKVDLNKSLSNLLVVNNDNYKDVEALAVNSIKVKQSELFERLGSWDSSNTGDGLFDLVKKLELNNKPLGEIIKKPQVGIKTGSNSCYIFNGENIPESIEKSRLLKEYLVGREVKRYHPTISNNKILAPYIFKDSQLKLVEENEFRTELNFLRGNKEMLSKRAIINKGIVSGKKKWYEFQQIKLDFPFHCKYIVYPDISSSVNFSFAENTFFDMTCFGIPSDSKSMLGLLNSSLVKTYLNLICVKARGGYLRLKSQYILKIPIPSNFENDDLNKLVSRIQNEVENFVKIQSLFSKYLLSQLKLDKLPKKLQKFYELDFVEFISELNKAIKRAGRDELPKLDEMKWMEVFETKKSEAQSLKAEIDKTDKEIDQMVYELYSLTKEEIEIVENATK